MPQRIIQVSQPMSHLDIWENPVRTRIHVWIWLRESSQLRWRDCRQKENETLCVTYFILIVVTKDSRLTFTDFHWLSLWGRLNLSVSMHVTHAVRTSIPLSCPMCWELLRQTACCEEIELDEELAGKLDGAAQAARSTFQHAASHYTGRQVESKTDLRTLSSSWRWTGSGRSLASPHVANVLAWHLLMLTSELPRAQQATDWAALWDLQGQSMWIVLCSYFFIWHWKWNFVAPGVPAAGKRHCSCISFHMSVVCMLTVKYTQADGTLLLLSPGLRIITVTVRTNLKRREIIVYLR